MLISKAPAKLIVAGEHGVLYGTPALTIPLQWHTQCHWQENPNATLKSDSQKPLYYDHTFLLAHWQKMQLRHQTWQNDPRHDMLQDGYDLPLTVLAWWQHYYPLACLSCDIRSNIPIGSGLGSSASLILAMLRGLAEWHQVSLSPNTLQDIATELEHFAHGKSSGLDVAAIQYNQGLWWSQSQATPITITPLKGYLINTGKPQSSTADCVRHVRAHHAHHHEIWQQMEQTIYQLKDKLLTQTNIASEVAQLQATLTTIGIVPQKVQVFTQAIEAFGWAGKQCGAGSITGEAGGFYWLLTDREPIEICRRFAYPYWSLDDLST
jgi:mevalonate kinase